MQHVVNPYFSRYIYLSGKIKVDTKRAKSGGAYKAMFLNPYFVLTNSTFYGASIGEVRFGGTFQVSDLQGAEIS